MQHRDILVYIGVSCLLLVLGYFITSSRHDIGSVRESIGVYTNPVLRITYQYPSSWSLKKVSPTGDSVGHVIAELFDASRRENISFSYYAMKDSTSCKDAQKMPTVCADFDHYVRSTLYHYATSTTQDGHIFYFGTVEGEKKVSNNRIFFGFVENRGMVYRFVYTSFAKTEEERMEGSHTLRTLMESISFMQ